MPTISWTTYYKKCSIYLLRGGSQQQTSPVAVAKTLFCKVKKSSKNNRLITCSSLESHFQLCLWRLLCSFYCINSRTLFLTVLGGIRYRCFSVRKRCCWRVSVLVTLPRRQGRVWAGRGRGREESQKQKRKGWAEPWGRGCHQIKSRDFVPRRQLQWLLFKQTFWKSTQKCP